MNAYIPTPTDAGHRGPVRCAHHTSVTSVIFEMCESEALGVMCDRAVNVSCSLFY